MARTTHVAKAQQRYKTVPVIDPETGEPKRTPVMKRYKDPESGEIIEKQKMTRAKNGRPARPVFMTVTKQDRTQPLPPETCDHCHQPIEIGTPYKHITPKSGPYGGRKRSRHETCPSWQVWDYSNSLSAQLARISYDFSQALEGIETPEDVTSALEDAANEVRDIATQKEESADNIEEGFGHETSASEELRQISEDLNGWADEIEQAEVPDLPDIEPRYYVTNGDGVAAPEFEEDGYETEADAQQALDDYRTDNGTNGDGDDNDDGFEVEEIEPEELSTEQIDEWRSEVSDMVTIVDESPV